MTRDLTERVPEEVLESFGFAGAHSEMFEQGIINRHWLVSDGDRLLVVRRYHPARTAAAIAWEQTLVEHAGKRGWPVATPKAAANGATVIEHEGRLWAAGPFLEGKTGAVDSPALFHIQGRLLGRLHKDLASFELEGQRPDYGKTWELDAWVETSNVGSFNELLSTFTKQYPDLGALIRRERYRNLRELSRLKYPDLPDMPIHGDFQRFNLLWQEGQVTGVLDFDSCRRDALLCDVAPLLMPHMPLDLKFAASLLEGYESVRRLSDEEWALMPALVRAGLLWWVAFCLVGWRTDGGPPESIARTMTVRWPAFEAAAAGLQALRGRQTV